MMVLEVETVDIREKIIQEITENLREKISGEMLTVIQDALVIRLNKYEIQERCTELAEVDTTAEKYLKKFIATKRIEGIAESTLKRYFDMAQKAIDFLKKPLQEVTTYDLRFYLSICRQKNHVSNRTLDGMRRCLSSFFGWLSAEGLIGRNPCAALSQIKYKKTVKKPFSATDLEKLRKACESIRDLALIDFLYSTGCRVSEVSKLDISDIDFERMECTVLGKGNKERIVYLSPVATMHLQEYLAERKDVSNALFTGKGGKRLEKNGIEVVVKKLGKVAKVENAHPHRFRRTLATNLLDRGMNIQDVAAILGHADLKTTQIYCYISQSNVKAAYNKYAA